MTLSWVGCVTLPTSVSLLLKSGMSLLRPEMVLGNRSGVLCEEDGTVPARIQVAVRCKAFA